ncbi:nitrate- and nitrite sensing domain-containing protein [Micromonospora sp. RHAY321]|uniref:sensor histidine kinase n=1 Tax=Micromonospora sp. RHAY321 TaxID=2944807 RepID=UPI00207C8D94|nr:nitrate- and nitrite sensing domain-containing protein [Micromonospora sp. RHAY321]MCO1596636.1 nitrate- and nitrite sensing domain-containing protein [Micromonospora sp. RHAY321]
MLLARLRIRGKLALLVLIPLLSMVGLAVPVVLDRVAAAQRADDIAERVRLASRVGSLVQDLQQERILSVGFLLGRVERAELIRKTADVDDRVADLRAAGSDALTDRIDHALYRVSSLVDLRTAVLARSASPTQVMDAFGPVNRGMIESLRLPFSVDTDTRPGRQVLALDGLLRADEGLGACATLIVLVKATDSPQASAAYVACIAALQVDSQRFRALITPEQLTVARLNDVAVAARTSPDFLVSSSRDPAGAIRDVPLDALFPSVRSMIRLGQFVEKKLVADVLAEVTAEQRRALTAAYLVGGAAALILAMVVLLSAVVARTVARPLTRLTLSADRVARLAEAELVRVADDETEIAQPVRLDPVDIRARDEIGDLARAFDRVQSTAARLVERQVAGRRNVAQMFGHVGRRTQNLVGRQIALIDRLEQQEADPGRLEHLYRLDHISSRLRRNAGSLVVLSGSAGADAHTAPVPLADVVRLALGEIEDYTRVEVRVPAGISAAPAVVGDLVLAMAELMENATVFSPPHTRVLVVGESSGLGARITVVDNGIGMNEQRLAEENARLTRRERLDLTPTEVLGLFVVGRLARRHGWTVNLAATPGGGVTARLEIPPASLVLRPADRAGVTVARAAVPDRDRRSPAAHDRDRGTRSLTPAAPAAAAGFDSDLLSRASRSLESGRSWDAFGAGASVPRQIGAPADASAAPAPVDLPATDSGLPRRPARGTAGGPGIAGAGIGQPGRTGPGRPEPTGTAGPRVRQRVPGASLPTTVAPVGPVDATNADPAAARALVEAFQAGVRRAERSVPTAGAGSAVVVDPGVTLDLPATPGGLGPTAADTDGSAGATSGRPRLSRRVPGANLTVTPPCQAASSHLGDPAEVRDLIREFEAGVARALREVSPDRRNEEGSSR